MTTSTLSAPRTLRIGAVSLRWSPRTLFVTLIAAIGTVVLAVLSLGAGEMSLRPDRVLAVLTGGGTEQEQLIVLTLRLTRTVLGILVGAMLALSGAIVQTTTRNGLASPDLLGVTAGAGTGAVAVIVLGGTGPTASGMSTLLHGLGTSAAALLGGLAAALTVAAILRLAAGGGLQMLLIGVGTSALFGGLTSWMLITANISDAARANVWLAGSLNGRGPIEVVLAAVTLGIIGAVLVPLSTRLPALHLGTDLASALGQDVRVPRSGRPLVSVVLASIAAAGAGPIGFVALVAPHIAHRATGAARPPLFTSALIGAGIVVASDLVARTIASPILLPTGAITAIIGAPFLIWLLVRQGKDSVR